MNDMTESNHGVRSSDGGRDMTRRAMLKTATAAAGAGVAITADAMTEISGAGAAAAAADGFGAPLAEIHVPAGVLTLEQKSAMIKGVTDVLVNATGLPPAQHRYLWVQIFETAAGGWGTGGQVFVPRSQPPAQQE